MSRYLSDEERLDEMRWANEPKVDINEAERLLEEWEDVREPDDGRDMLELWLDVGDEFLVEEVLRLYDEQA